MKVEQLSYCALKELQYAFVIQTFAFMMGLLDESLLSQTKGMPKGSPRLGSPQGSEEPQWSLKHLFMCAWFIAAIFA